MTYEYFLLKNFYCTKVQFFHRWNWFQSSMGGSYYGELVKLWILLFISDLAFNFILGTPWVSALPRGHGLQKLFVSLDFSSSAHGECSFLGHAFALRIRDTIVELPSHKSQSLIFIVCCFLVCLHKLLRHRLRSRSSHGTGSDC